MKNMTFMESVKMMPLMALPVRSTVIHLKNAKVLISPGSNLTSEQLKNLNFVTDIVAPNLFHSAGVPLAAEIFSKAKIWGVEGSKEKKSDIVWNGILSEQSWPYQEELPNISILGMPKICETVFVHKESKSLIVTDLCFNMVDAQGIGAWLILNMFGTYRKLGISKFFAKYIVDEKAFRKSIEHLLSHDFDNIIVSHGKIIEGNGKKLFINALIERGLYPSQ